MTTYWGCDCVAACSSSVGGTNLANYVINTYYGGSPHDQIIYWGRYFDWRDADTFIGDIEATDLSHAVEAYANPSGNRAWIAPLCAPSSLSGGVGNPSGTTVGNFVCAKIAAHITSHLKMPGSQKLYVWLDVEPNEHVDATFWSQFAAAVNNYYYTPSGNYPFYAAVYIRLTDPSVATIVSGGGCYAAWSQQPQPSCSANGCNSPGPTWAGPSSPFSDGTLLWQYGEAGRCQTCRGNLPKVDLDSTNPGYNGPSGFSTCDNMLYVPPA